MNRTPSALVSLSDRCPTAANLTCSSAVQSGPAPVAPAPPDAPRKVRKNEPLGSLARPELAVLSRADHLPPYRTPSPPPLISWIQAKRPRKDYSTGGPARSRSSTFARH